MSKTEKSRQLELQLRCFHSDGDFVPFPRSSLEYGVPTRFHEQVRLHGNRLAVVSDDGDLTYANLNNFANHIACALLAISREPGQSVALLIEQGGKTIAASLGALKAGKAFVPLEAHWPVARIISILNHSRATVLVTSKKNLSLAHTVVEGGKKLVVLEDLLISGHCADPTIPINPDDPAYVLYTSGSTGHPKGILDSHRNLMHEVMRITNSLHVCSLDRQSLLRANCAGAISDTFTALLNGATLFPFDVLSLGVPSLISWLNREQITIWRSTPSIFRAMVSTLKSHEQLAHLRVLFLCGESANATDIESYRAHCGPDCLFVNCLGSTEAATVTLYFLDRHESVLHGEVPVGFPVDDMEVQIVNDSGDLVANAEEGEIVIRSQYLATGYFEDPALTEKSFRKDSMNPGFRQFLSGDIGRREEDGNLVCLGRRDLRVNLQGQSFELSEIETALLGKYDFREAVATVVTDVRGISQVVIYIVPSILPCPSYEEIRHYLSEWIPSFAIPSKIITLERVPLTATGKVDRKQLSSSIGAQLGSQDGYVAPKTPVEELLAPHWQDLLNIECVGRHDNFFQLGGHSLLGTQLVARLRDQYQIDIPLRILFDYPTLATQAAAIEETFLREISHLSEFELEQLIASDELTN